MPPLSVAPAGADPAASADADRYEAVRLFADRAAASRPGFAVGPDNVAAVTSICRALDGMPLAIELAAARVRALSVEQISARLDDRFGLLTAGDRSAAPRQRTLRAAIEWSYELLTAPERTLFRRLSVFTGWSLEMAEQVCADEDIPAADVLGLTAALVDKSLVVLDPEVLGQARYRMLDTIREYAAMRLAQAGESAAVRLRLRDYALRTAEHNLAIGMARVPAPWATRVDVFRRYDVDAGNVAQVLNWCLEAGDAEAGLRICAAVSPCWIVWGTFGEGGEWLRSLLALDMTAVPAWVQGAATVVRAQLALSSDPAAASSLATDGLKLCREAGDGYWTAVALNLLSEIALHTGRTDEAAASADEALSIAQAAGDGWNEGYALGTRAAIAARRGKLREAEQLATASVSRDAADRPAVGRRPGPARPRGPGQVPQSPGRGARLVRGSPGHPAGDRRPAGDRALPGRAGAGGHGPRRDRAGQAAPDQEPAAQPRHRRAHQRGPRARGLRGPGRAREPARAGRAAGRGGGRAAGDGGPAAAARRAHGRLPGSGAPPARRRRRRPAVGQRPGPDQRGRGRAGPGPAGAAAAGDDESPALTVVGSYQVASAPPSSLTHREHQIATLVASGRSNKAIADELSISPTTAARHVANIMAKLGFNSRTQIAAWIAEKPQGTGRADGPAEPV